MRSAYVVLWMVACNREPPHAAAIVGEVAAPVVVAPAAVSASSSVAPVREPPASYAEAMKRGRESTIAARYGDAIEDFTTAISFGDTAQAEGELGYAQLLANKPTDASQSLENAMRLDPAADLEAQIQFNVGLTEEKLGNAELARAAFAKANAKHASTAAQAKLAGQSQCAASIVRETMVTGSHDAGGATAYLLTTSWRDVWAFAAERGAPLLTPPHDWTTKPNEAQARAALTEDAGAPWSIGLGHLMFRDAFVYAAPASGGRVIAVDGGMNGGGCTGMGARPASTSSAEIHGTVFQVNETVQWWTDASCKTNRARTETLTTFYDVDALHIVRVSAAAALNGRSITITAAGCTPVTL